MMNLLLEISAFDPATSSFVAVRACSAAAGMNETNLDGKSWSPVITGGTDFSFDYWSDGPKPLDTSYGSLSINLDVDSGANVWPAYSHEGALGTVWVGQPGAAFASYRKIWTGAVGPLVRDGNEPTAKLTLYGAEASLAVDLLSDTYAGTGGASGTTSLSGTFKPYAVGACVSIAPVLIDPIKWVYQYHGYGACEVSSVYEAAYPLGPATYTVTTYEALIALTLADGQWAACPAQGMFRLKNEPTGKITADVGASSACGAVIRSLILKAGLAPNRVDSSIDATTGRNFNLYATDQTSIYDAVRDAAFAASKIVFPNGEGVFCVAPFVSVKNPTVLTSNRSTLPLVRNDTIVEEPKSLPAYRVRVGHTRVWAVHSTGEVSPALREISAQQAANDAKAQAAAEKADEATAAAALAATFYESMVSDSILDRPEKLRLIERFEGYTGERGGLINEANNQGVTVQRDAYANAYAQLAAYLTGLSPAYNDTSRDTPINGNEFKGYLTGYDIAKSSLLNAIANMAAKTAGWTNIPDRPTNLGALDPAAGEKLDGIVPGATVGAPVGTNVGGRPVVDLISDLDKAKADATKATTAADTAQRAAESASFDAAAAKDRLAAIDADGVLDRSEKSDVIQHFNSATAERDGLVAKGNEFGLTGERDAYANAYTALLTLLTNLSPSYADTTTDTPIDRAAFNTVWTAYFTARQNLLNAVYSKARTLAAGAQATADTAKTASDNAKAAADEAKVQAAGVTANFTAARLGQILKQPLDEIAALSLDYGAQSLITSKDFFDRSQSSVQNLQSLILNADGSIKIEKLSGLSAAIATKVGEETTARQVQFQSLQKAFQDGDALIAQDVQTLGTRVTREVGGMKTTYDAAIRDTKQAVIDGDYAQALRSDALSASLTGLVDSNGIITQLSAAVQRIDQAEVDNNGARAAETVALKSRLDNLNGASLEQNFTTFATKLDGVGAQYVLKVQTEQNGTKTVAGMGLAVDNGVSAIAFNADAFRINVPGAGVVPVFAADADGVYMPNVRVNKLAANSITINEIAPGLSRSPRYTAPDIMIPAYETTIIETPWFSVGFNNTATGATENGSSLATLSFTHDGTQVVDTGANIRVYVDTGNGYEFIRNSLSGISTRDGNTVWSLKYTDTIAITAPGTARVKITAQGTGMGNSTRNSGTYARSPEINIISIGR